MMVEGDLDASCHEVVLGQLGRWLQSLEGVLKIEGQGSYKTGAVFLLLYLCTLFNP